jgi:hypothetical protein
VVTEEDVRAAALALPSATEKSCYGTPGFYVAGKLFARIHDLPDTLMVRVPDVEDKDALVAGEPRLFFTTAHYDGYAGVLVRLDKVTRRRLDQLLLDAWRTRAPKRLLGAHG